MIRLRIDGVPKPGGSKRAFVINGRARLTDASGKAGKDWRGDVKAVARQVYGGPLLSVPLSVRVTFIMPRPQKHYRANGQLKPTAPAMCPTKPDATKLWRSAEDALTGVLWADDALIVDQHVQKRYAAPGERPGAEIAVWEWAIPREAM